VRPQTLVKDGFLVQVKEELAQKDLLGTLAIVVEADDCWKPKVGPQLSRMRGADLEHVEVAALAAAASPRSDADIDGQAKQKVVEVVELD
jgi:hypothetical protein